MLQRHAFGWQAIPGSEHPTRPPYPFNLQTWHPFVASKQNMRFSRHNKSTATHQRREVNICRRLAPASFIDCSNASRCPLPKDRCVCPLMAIVSRLTHLSRATCRLVALGESRKLLHQMALCLRQQQPALQQARRRPSTRSVQVSSVGKSTGGLRNLLHDSDRLLSAAMSSVAQTPRTSITVRGDLLRVSQSC